jgi:hypothetical protein
MGGQDDRDLGQLLWHCGSSTSHEGAKSARGGSPCVWEREDGVSAEGATN